MSSQRWQRGGGEEHAWRRPGRSSSFVGNRGRGTGGRGSSGQPSRSYWRPVNAHGEHQQKAPDAAAAQHAQYFPATTSTSYHQTPNLDVELKLKDREPPEEFEVAPSRAVLLELKQQPLQHQVPQHPLLSQQQQQTRKDDDVSSQSNSVNPRILISSHAKPLEETRTPFQHQEAHAPSPIPTPMGLADSSVLRVQQNQQLQKAMPHQRQETEETKADKGMHSSRQLALPNSTPRSEPVDNLPPILIPLARSGYYELSRKHKGVMLHKANKKYVSAKVEQAKRRQLNAILNKLTQQNFGKLCRKVREVNIDNAETLSWFVSQIFHRALMEPIFCKIYAEFCRQMSPLFCSGGDDKVITFRRLLWTKCQEEFERGKKKDEEAGKTEEEAEIDQTTEEKNILARRRMLGNIRFIGELYTAGEPMEHIMHICIKKLIGDIHSPDEGKIEALCILMSIIGGRIDHLKVKEHMDAYFDNMQELSRDQKLSWRVKFLLRDLIDLRKNQWQQKCEIIDFSE